MAVVPLEDIVDPAFEARYGVPAINIFNDLTMEGVLADAVEANFPVILQTSVKTVRSYRLPRAVRREGKGSRRSRLRGGDGGPCYSLASSFEKALADWHFFKCDNAGTCRAGSLRWACRCRTRKSFEEQVKGL